MDNNNKPDFRYLFTSRQTAEEKRKEIKNSTVGETLFVSKTKRDFFVDGVQKKFIGPEKLINIKKGCWVTLKTKKLLILDTIQPEIYFKEIIKESEPVIENITVRQTTSNTKKIKSPVHQSGHPKVNAPNTPKKTNFKIFSNEFYENNSITKKHTSIKQNSALATQNKKINLLIPQESFTFLKTKLFAFNFAMILLACLISIAYVNNKSHKKIATAIASKQESITKEIPTINEDTIAVLGTKDAQKNNTQSPDEVDKIVFNTLQKFEKIRQEELEAKVKEMVAGSPMEKMAPYIAQQDKIVAAFLVGIAKKESNYGRRVPVLNGKDCYNYWGYRGIRKRMGTGGHTCFDSPEDAVKTVGGRISRLVKSGVDTPQEMVLWKCGSNCNATGGWAAARKWISDVNMYYSKMLKLTNETTDEDEEESLLNNSTEPSA